MLSELHIQNIAVIQKASIPFTKGFNVFTGETGAGKTILLSALDAVLGERTSRDIIRSGEDKAQVSALFEEISDEVKQTLERIGFQAPDHSVLIYREMTASGRNTCRVNGMPATVSLLKEISQHLIHIHGQRDTGQLLTAEYHLQMVDQFGDLERDIAAYQKHYKTLQKLKTQLTSLDMDESQKEQRLDLLRFQIADIEAAELEDPQEEEDLLAEKRMIGGSERIRQGLSAACGAYDEGGERPGMEELMSLFVSGVEQASGYMDSLIPTAERAEELRYQLADMARELQIALEDLDFDPQILDGIERRLDVLYNLKRKYGGSITDILEHYSEAKTEFESISLNDEKKQALQEEIAAITVVCQGHALKLSRKRARACKGFIEQVEGELAFLDMPDAALSVAHKTVELGPLGTDQLEFMIVTNVGESPKPLGKIASGGELARIMLGIKNVMADRDNIDTLIFDEIDTGVSGRAAGKIGRKLAEVAKTRQVLCVTHLAQVAAFADNHLYIHKTTSDHRTFTKVEALSAKEAVTELARITSGEVITAAAIASAQELIERAQSPYQES